MAKPIKFRVWDKDNKKFLCEGSNICISMSGTVLDIADDSFLHQEGYIIQQFTGMHDQNGVEIYEGDIVQLCNCDRDYFTDVQYNKSFWYPFSNGLNNDCNDDLFLSTSTIVVGNILENKKLLEGARWF